MDLKVEAQIKVPLELPKNDRFIPLTIQTFEGLQTSELVHVEDLRKDWMPSSNEMIKAYFTEAVRRFEDGLIEKDPSGTTWHNGTLYTLEDMTIDPEGGALNIKLGKVKYYDYLVANTGEMKDSPDIEKPNPLILSALLVTTDNKLVFGARTPNTDIPTSQDLKRKIGVIGGTYSLGMGPFEKIGSEISKELGISLEEFSLNLTAVATDAVFHRATMFFAGRIGLSSQEISDSFILGGNKSEHTGLYFVDLNRESLETLLEEDLTVATTIGIGILSAYGIFI